MVNLKKYRFLDGKEPTDRQLEGIMKAAIIAAVKKQENANKIAKAKQKKELSILKKQYSTITSLYAAKA